MTSYCFRIYKYLHRFTLKSVQILINTGIMLKYRNDRSVSWRLSCIKFDDLQLIFFLLFTALSDHMARVHNRNKNCETCKKMYRRSCSIKNHPWEYVEPTELHQCPHCPYKSSKGQLISKGLFGVIVSTNKPTLFIIYRTRATITRS